MSDVRDANVSRERAYQNRMSQQEALALCDTLPSVDIETLTGLWRGSEVSTNHPMDGLLAACGWYGKEFIDRDHVHPLQFADRRGVLFAIDPQRLPLSIGLKLRFLLRTPLTRRAVLLLRILLQTRRTRARVRMLEYRGKLSATMIYDNLPIYDTFRLIDHNTLLGIMDYKGMEQPFFFKLRRV
ncbi:DUF4334 domain-containing protein [Dictyobacter aurantiacus]|uniref:DUF4334 domain-containing protein n=1 Tax=Dictyobacter aurantiacus TaxID=1936993 RepID=A0A401ZIS1_9CHLR|nr:DUF4334 domain-containing protein [Dictyobacter aurantiacus]GCE06747.1 hypothetical protein KDAU_40760 [Dictyobacter aurantiacus]